MATQGAIARLLQQQPLRFTGSYIHHDSAPPDLGKTLWHVYHNHFQQNLKAMLQFFIDEHPAGWSSIVGTNFKLLPGFVAPRVDASDAPAPDGLRAPACYCHGERHDPAHPVTQRNAIGLGCRFVYLFDEEHGTLMIAALVDDALSQVDEPKLDKSVLWRVLAEVDLTGAEPDWYSLRA